MRILVVGEDVHNYLQRYVQAIRKIGNTSDAYVVDFNFSRRNFLEKAMSYDHILFINNNFRIVFSDDDLLFTLKAAGKFLTVIYIDCIKKMRGNQYLECFDKIYTFSPKDVVELSRKYNNVSFLPLGADDVYITNDEKVTEKNNDVIFAGSKSDKRLVYLEAVAEYCYRNNKKMLVYGHFWHNSNRINEFFSYIKFKMKHPYLYRYICNYDISPEKLSYLYKSSKVCLNIHIEETGEVNARTFEILGNGNYQMVDCNSSFDKLGLVDGKNITTFNSIEECIEKLDYYLRNDEKRVCIGANGQNLVYEKYRLDYLMREVFYAK